MMPMQQIIPDQTAFKQSAPALPSERERRGWHSRYKLADDAVVELTGAPLVLPRGLNSKRAKIILQAVQTGHTVAEINRHAKAIHGAAEPDGDIWIAIMRGYARLRSRATKR